MRLSEKVLIEKILSLDLANWSIYVETGESCCLKWSFSLTLCEIPWRFSLILPNVKISLTLCKIPWQFPDLENFYFSLTFPWQLWTLSITHLQVTITVSLVTFYWYHLLSLSLYQTILFQWTSSEDILVASNAQHVYLIIISAIYYASSSQKQVHTWNWIFSLKDFIFGKQLCVYQMFCFIIFFKFCFKFTIQPEGAKQNTVVITPFVFIVLGIILCMRPTNEGRRYNVTSSLIGWAHSQNDPWLCPGPAVHRPLFRGNNRHHAYHNSSLSTPLGTIEFLNPSPFNI